MAHLQSKKIQAEVFLERFTWVDKKSMFRTSEPNRYYLQIMIRTPKSLVVAREFIFNTKAEQTQHYKHLRICFDLDK